MTTRRNFLKATAASGIVFCSCGLLDAAHAQQALNAHQPEGGHRLPVMVDGKRVKTIDVHAHCNFHEVETSLGAEASVPLPPVNGAKDAYIEIENRLKAMDAQAVDMEVLSINPFWYGKDRDLAEKIVKSRTRSWPSSAPPSRIASSPSPRSPCRPRPRRAAARNRDEEAGPARRSHRRRVNGVEFSDPKFNPVWAKAEELGALLFIHPLGVPEPAKRFAGNGWLGNTIGNPLETTIALSHLIFEGTLDRHPGLKIIAAHGGGFLPSYADRSDHACFVGPAGCDPKITLKKRPSEYLKQLYFDSLIYSPEAMRHLAAQVGADRIVMGSDYPYPWQLHPVDAVFDTSFSNNEKAGILGATAARLLNIKA